MASNFTPLDCPSCSGTGRDGRYCCRTCDGTGHRRCNICHEPATRIAGDDVACEACGALVEADIARLCSAGEDHEQLRRVDVLWNALEYVGMQSDDVETIELRNCSCHSTLARVIARVTEIQDGAGNVTYRAPIAAGAVR